MAEPGTDRRAPPPAAVSTTAATFGAVGLAVATVDYFFKVHVSHVWIQPDEALIAFWVAALAPTAHLIFKIINNHLKKLAGESNDAI